MFLPQRDSKAFTLLELIVVIVILGILTAIAIPTFQKVIGKSKDNSAQQTLSALHREAAALAAFRGLGAFATDDVFGAGSGLNAAGAGLYASGTTITQDSDASPAVSDARGHVVFRLSSDFSGLGLAMLSDSGRCVTSLGTVAGNAVTTVHPNAAACDGDLALTGAASAAPAPAPEPAPVVVSYSTGPLDETFDGDGKVVTAMGASSDIGYALEVQGDGKILLSGSAYVGSTSDFALVRYNADGSLDTTFGGSGKVTTDIGGSNDVVEDLVVRSDGKIVVAGHAVNGALYDFAAAVYNSDGSLDTTFSADGKVMTSIGSSNSAARSAAVQGDGKIVLAGHTANATEDFAVVRYNTDGSLDTTFDGDGKAVTHVVSGGDYGYGVVAQSSGKIVVGGYVHNGANYDFGLVRYNADGSLDATFDGDGKVTTQIGSSHDIPQDLVEQSDGKLVLVGYTVLATVDFAVVRYSADGVLDSTFGSGGMLATSVGSGVDHARSVTLQGDGKLVVGGTSSNGTNDDFSVVRYNADGSLDATFDGDGKVMTPIGAGADTGEGVAIQPDGKLVVGGYYHNGTDTDFAVVRYK